ncbi:MAG: FAD-dependent thymidylate synthase [bacterium]|nr:FAD-dependent thymidylate synthase [bacterium]
MKVVLAGYNIDAQIVEELKKKADWNEDNVSPETLSASYARISRDPRDITELRKEACVEVDKARKSNEMIIFGLGHSSVAEHAVFNFDIINISRLAVEEVQRFRLASFTEKSQRYITLDGDYYIPEELKGSPLEDEFASVIAIQNKGYTALYTALKEHLFKKHSEMVSTKMGERTVDGWAKEDARYVVSLATLSQFGMTVNARTLELMLRRFNGSSLDEIKTLGSRIYEIVGSSCPSIIKYTNATPYDTETPKMLQTRLMELENKYTVNQTANRGPEISMEYYTPDPDTIVTATVLFHNSSYSFGSSLDMAKQLTSEEKEAIIKTTLEKRESYDSVSRYFEMIDFTFDVTVSASNYAQLKRHRISTQIVQDYNPALGYTVPPNIVEIGKKEEFDRIMEATGELYSRLQEQDQGMQNYILTNAHRRRVLFKLNGRELYHFTGLRDDEHAQWDIQDSAQKIRSLVEEAAPLTSLMLCGKDSFSEKQKKVFI